MSSSTPRFVDTVIIGNGPSSLILSYILHGNIPTYDLSNPHPDPLLHGKLKSSIDLLNLDVDRVTGHFSASRFSYSTQALPVNVLLDTLIRPLGETDDAGVKSCVSWKHQPERAVSHLVIGEAGQAGGQWADNPVKASWDIGTLSYARMLSLPGYSFDQYYVEKFGRSCPPFTRPTRRLIADYFASYPSHVSISDSIVCGQKIEGVSRTPNGFNIESRKLRCKYIVLASGTFSELIPARPLLQPLLKLPGFENKTSREPLLVIGSGFSAADVIISSVCSQKIIHIFKWAPTTAPSPLKACHQQAYPEYASVYQKMKFAALSSRSSKNPRPRVRRASSAFDQARDWGAIYEGFPNTVVTNVTMEDNTAVITFRDSENNSFERRIGSFAYVVGRRGNLNYLDEKLRKQVWPESVSGQLLSGQTLREKANENLEVTDGVFIIGSLTGDSLIRFAYGSCVFAAGRIIKTRKSGASSNSSRTSCCSSKVSSPHIQAMHGLDGHNYSPMTLEGNCENCN